MVADILQDRRVLGDDDARLDLERGNGAARIDREVIGLMLRLLRLQVDGFQLIGKAGFAQDDMRRERAGAGLIVQFHGSLLSGHDGRLLSSPARPATRIPTLLRVDGRRLAVPKPAERRRPEAITPVFHERSYS
jgi:hypothetical protein